MSHEALLQLTSAKGRYCRKVALSFSYVDEDDRCNAGTGRVKPPGLASHAFHVEVADLCGLVTQGLQLLERSELKYAVA